MDVIRFTKQFELVHQKTVYEHDNVKFIVAYDNMLKRQVGLKKVTCKSSREVKQLQKEAEQLSKASRYSRYVPDVYFINNKDNNFTIAMQYIDDAKNLNDWLLESQDQTQRLRMYEKLCDVLVQVHNSGIQHRDLKPENILINRNEEVFIVDFGLSGQAFSMDEGTKMYRAPEQESKYLKFSERTVDQFSMGVLLYQILTDEVPAIGKHYSQESKERRNPNMKMEWKWKITAMDINPIVSLKLWNVCMKLMSNIPSKRPKKMSDVKHEIKQTIKNTRGNRR